MKNHRVITVKALPATNHSETRVQIKESRFRITKRKVLSYDYNIDDVLKQAIEYLQNIGINVVGYGSDNDQYYLFSDTWGGENFIEIS